MHILRKPSRISKRDQFTNYKTTIIFSPQRSILLIDSRSPYTESINLALASGTRFSSFLFWKASEVTSSRNRLRRVAVTKWYVLGAVWRPAVYAAESELTWPVLIRAGDMILTVALNNAQLRLDDSESRHSEFGRGYGIARFCVGRKGGLNMKTTGPNIFTSVRGRQFFFAYYRNVQRQ